MRVKRSYRCEQLDTLLLLLVEPFPITSNLNEQ